MKTKISALLDGELDAQEMRDVLLAMRDDAELRRISGTYALIGDALRGESHLAMDISEAVIGELVNEPIVFAPRAIAHPLPQRKPWLRSGLALAATAAGVAVVAWLTLPRQTEQMTQIALQAIQPGGQRAGQPMPSSSPSSVARNTSGTQSMAHPVAHPLVVAASEDPDMQEYLIAHQIHSGSIFLNGDTQHIRTVSMTGVESR